MLILVLNLVISAMQSIGLIAIHVCDSGNHICQNHVMISDGMDEVVIEHNRLIAFYNDTIDGQ